MGTEFSSSAKLAAESPWSLFWALPSSLNPQCLDPHQAVCWSLLLIPPGWCCPALWSPGRLQNSRVFKPFLKPEPHLGLLHRCEFPFCSCALSPGGAWTLGFPLHHQLHARWTHYTHPHFYSLLHDSCSAPGKLEPLSGAVSPQGGMRDHQLGHRDPAEGTRDIP